MQSGRVQLNQVKTRKDKSIWNGEEENKHIQINRNSNTSNKKRFDGWKGKQMIWNLPSRKSLIKGQG